LFKADSAKRASARGQGDQMKVVSPQWSAARESVFSLTFGVVLFALCISAEAQQPRKVSRIGILVGGSASSDSARIEALRKGLRDLGYIEGKTSSWSMGTQTENQIA
jgi:hypothetical protein